MLREKLVFGPIFSRRLGSSLGINLLPEQGRLVVVDLPGEVGGQVALAALECNACHRACLLLGQSPAK